MRALGALEKIVMEIDLEQARRRAKELLRAARAGDPDALTRMRGDRALRLADAQRAVAVELGFSSWPGLVTRLEAAFKSEETMRILAAEGASTELDPAGEWIGAVVRGDDHRAARVKAEHPGMVLRAADIEQLSRWASAGDDEVVARLLDAGVPVDARGVDGGTPLHCAGLWGRGSTAELLLERGGDPEMMSAPGDRLGTPLSWTAWGSRNLPGAAERLEGYLAAARALIAAGARVTEWMVEVAADELCAVLEDAAAWAGILRVTSLSYVPGRPARIRIRRREHRYDIDDMGTAVAIAGRPPGWREAAERAVNRLGWNINRHGVVRVFAVEGQDIDALVQRTAEVSRTVFETLVEIEEPVAIGQRRAGFSD
jgi:hypothetical protein